MGNSSSAASMCGNSVLDVALGEQCDDGAHVDGDGCSASCQLEGNYLLEMEANDTAGTANALGTAAGFVAASINSPDLDFFTFEVTVPGSSVHALISDGLGGCPEGFDSFIKLYAQGSSTRLEANHDVNGYCSELRPTMDRGATNLDVGTYLLSVENAFPGDVPLYVLDINVLQPRCNDRVRQLSEQCDDGNNNPGDGCSATCQLERNYLPETEVNDTVSLANSVNGFDGAVGAINPLGDQDCFGFDVVTPGSSVFVVSGDGLGGCPGGPVPTLSLYSPAGTLLASEDYGVTTLCASLVPAFHPETTGLAPGSYKVCAAAYRNSTPIPFYVLDILVRAPGCGDSVLQAGEQCDDGNQDPGDGCSAMCTVDAPYELEPNNTQATATPAWPGFSSWIGRISPVGDRDHFTFTLASAGMVTLSTHNPGDAATCDEDTFMHLLNSTGTQLHQDDDSGVGYCSLIGPTQLAAGTYDVWVQTYLDGDVTLPYQLDLMVQ